ncbi:MAG: NCS2 family permease [Bdellovibrionales bacterium]|nr:NCS2 family permease [Bdellovibrionales bacterium]
MLNTVFPKTRKEASREAIGGITTFFTMAYIVVVNPAILSTEGTGMPFSGVLTATVLLSAVCTLLMGLYAKLPFAVAPGMGINAFFTYTVILGQQVPWATALGMVFWAGVIFILVSVTPVRVAIAKAIPHNLRIASATGIGVFISFIGLKNAGVIAAHPVTFVTVGKLGWPTLAFFSGLAAGVWLMRRKNPFALLAALGLGTAIGAGAGLVGAPASFVSAPDFSLFLKADFAGALDLQFLPIIITLFATDLFDSISTFVGVSQAGGLLDSKGNAKNLKEGLLVDAVATVGAGLAGTSSGTAYIESAAGIEAGARTGFASVVTALCFLPCLFLAPLAGMVPGFATASVLVLVGALMFRSVKELKLGALEDSLPAFLTIVLIPLTFSITQGILWGFLAHTALYLLSGRGREVGGGLYAIAGLSAVLLWISDLG